MHQSPLRKDRLGGIKEGTEGFSLVELAVVLVIVGLLIGGILKGQELIESARLKKVVAQLNEYRVATSNFLDRYDALPGDFAKAREQIDPSLSNGNGNGVVEGQGLEEGSEALAFWSHLAGSGLIGYPGKKEEVQGGQFGKGAPASPIGGGYTVENNPSDDLKGLWFILGNASGSAGKGALLTPQQAMSIDKKMDTGNPSSGKVRAKDGENGGGSCLSGDGEYNVEINEPACVLYFQL